MDEYRSALTKYRGSGQEPSTGEKNWLEEYKAAKEKLASGGASAIPVPNLPKQAQDIFLPQQTQELQIPQYKTPESNGWFQSGAFEDGYQFGDLTKTILGTGRDVKEDAVAGAVGVGEKALDFLAFIAPYISQGMWNMNGGDFAPAEFRQAQQQQFQSAKDLSSEFIKKDIIDEQKIGQAVAKIGDGLIPNLILGKEKADDMSVLGEKSDALVQSLGQMALTAAMGGAVPWWVVTGASGFGGEAENALKQGATMEQAGLSAAVSAGAEILTEKLFGGSGLGEKGFINLDSLTNGISNKLVKTLLDYGVDMAAEGAEEVVSSVASNLGSALYREENLADILFSKEALQEYLDNFVSGAAVGGLMNIGKVGSSISNKTDYRNGLTAQEQKVFDTEYNDVITEAEKSGKLTKDQKAEIYDSVLEDVISRRPAPQQAATPTQSGETEQSEKVPTQAESTADGQQTAQTVPQITEGNQQTEDSATRAANYKSRKVNQAILQLVERVKSGLSTGKEKVQLPSVSDMAATRIQKLTGIDVRGYKVEIEARQIDHILKDHGENGSTDRSMADASDIAKMEYALENPETITVRSHISSISAIETWRSPL